MLVVADTGPPHYLVLSDTIELLPRLFGRVVLPNVVRDELQHSRTPEPVRRWIAAAPEWIEVVASPSFADTHGPPIGAGERAAIAVALAHRADLVLMDDRQGVAAAIAAGLRVIGTIGLLDQAARRGLIDLTAAFARLRATNFRCRPELLDAVLAQHQERKGADG